MDKQFPVALRAAAPYINAHRGRIAVVHIPGEVSQGPDRVALVHDLAVAHSLGLKLVLVLGARPQIDARLAAMGQESQFVGGHRVTSPRVLDCVKEAVGHLRSEFEALLSTSLASTPMGGARIRVVGGNLAIARPVGVRDGIDLQHTGELRRLDLESFGAHLGESRIVLLSPLAYSPSGEIFNLQTESLAVATAAALSADKLILLQDQPIERGECDLQNPPANPDPTVSLALDAVRRGVLRAHLIGAGEDGALLRELYTADGTGMMVSAEAFDELRPASIDDIGGLLQLIEPLERDGIIVPRSREQLELDIEQFSVMARDEQIIGCRALFAFPGSSAAELACIVVAPEYQHGGRATALLRDAETKARQLGLKMLFVLTTHTAHWFIEHGFVAGTLDQLPPQRQAFYNYQRQSKVFIKTL